MSLIVPDLAEVRSRLVSRSPLWSGEIDGDFMLNPAMREAVLANATKKAAVLFGLVDRDGETRLILTKRTEKLSSHSGQIAFPGGRIDDDDASPEAAALREAWEEIGLDQNEVDVIGRLPDYHSGSGFVISPVIGHVSHSADFEINYDEVEYMFEVPLSFLMDEANHNLASREFMGSERFYYEMPYGEHYIWGVTASMIRIFRDRIFINDAA